MKHNSLICLHAVLVFFASSVFASDYEYDVSGQQLFHPKDPVESYAQAARIYFACCRKGITVRSTIDCLIAQIALEHDLFLLHNDSDFIAMATVIGLRLI